LGGENVKAVANYRQLQQETTNQFYSAASVPFSPDASKSKAVTYQVSINNCRT
jgi:hypothetical protein